MRPLTSEEEEKVVQKLRHFIGDNANEMLKDKTLYYSKQRVMLVSEHIFKAVAQIGKKQLASCGAIVGRFTKTNSFKITITGLYSLEKFALYKAWIKTSAEMNFLYGNNALKNHILRLSEEIPINAGVFVYNQHNIPLGFGISAVSPSSYMKARGGDIVVLNQADNGEYIRKETNIA
ncbi:60S ribosome subunit biogenesis protein NIP7 [Enteropsectra breve]|nr:60S ribosome subunit biogenesis protein NIP7 [Enteropsectra breve]